MSNPRMAPEMIEANVTMLTERFPQAFDPKNPKPLKLGIRDDLAALAPEVDLGVLGPWCGRPRYLKALIAGESRVDLDGNPVWEPTQAERDDAAARLKALKDRQKANKGKTAKEPKPQAQHDDKQKPAESAPARPTQSKPANAMHLAMVRAMSRPKLTLKTK